MKINLSEIDTEQFKIHQHVLNGEVVWLVQPQQISCKWTQLNKYFRSSLWDNDGNLISPGFYKFPNWGENPENFPLPTSLDNATVVEKIDGSLLCISKYKSQFIIRTRGTIDAISTMENGYELETFKLKYPKIFELHSEMETWTFTLLFEWYSPANRIVIKYSDMPEWYLVGIVDHDDYVLWTQDQLDIYAEQFGCPRPETFKFSDINSMMSAVEKWETKEGIVIYSESDQSLHKIKAFSYLVKHRLKEEFGNIEKIIDFYIQEKCPDYNTFMSRIEEVVDFETANECRGDCSKIIDAYKEVVNIMDGMNKFVNETLKSLSTRKDQALKVLSSYGNTNRASFCFKLLDKKDLDGNDIKKLLYQCLK